MPIAKPDLKGLSEDGIVMIEAIRHLDHIIFHFINHDMANKVLDIICPMLREKLLWIPLYALIAFLLFRKYGTKTTLWFALLAILTIVLSDQGSNLLKHFFHRLRPCNNPEFAASSRLLLDSCGVGFSFVSAHAANHFALATFLSFLFTGNRKMVVFLFIWAASIAFSQVYVGVHFPVDVACGALLGITVGLITGRVAAWIVANSNYQGKN